LLIWTDSKQILGLAWEFARAALCAPELRKQRAGRARNYGDPMADDEESWERRRIEGALERVFPQARSMELTSLANDGAFLALLRLPTRIGEASIAIHRHGHGPPPEEEALVGLTHRMASGHGDWHWLVEYDSQASEAEVLQLVVKQLLRDPQVGDPDEDDRQRYGSVDPDAMPDVWWVCATGPHIFPDRPGSQAEELECPVPDCGSAPLDHPYASEDQAREVVVQRQGGS